MSAAQESDQKTLARANRRHRWRGYRSRGTTIDDIRSVEGKTMTTTQVPWLPYRLPRGSGIGYQTLIPFPPLDPAGASHELCGDADDVFVDPKRARIYVSCGEGFLDVFDARDANRGRLARVPTSPGARTSYYVASLDRLFLAVRATSAQPASIWVYRPAP
jgi:hypothetical protein